MCGRQSATIMLRPTGRAGEGDSSRTGPRSSESRAAVAVGVAVTPTFCLTGGTGVGAVTAFHPLSLAGVQCWQRAALRWRLLRYMSASAAASS